MKDQVLWCLCGWHGAKHNLSKVYNRIVSDALSECGHWQKMYSFSCPECRRFFFITTVEENNFTEGDRI